MSKNEEEIVIEFNDNNDNNNDNQPTWHWYNPFSWGNNANNNTLEQDLEVEVEEEEDEEAEFDNNKTVHERCKVAKQLINAALKAYEQNFPNANLNIVANNNNNGGCYNTTLSLFKRSEPNNQKTDKKYADILKSKLETISDQLFKDTYSWRYGDEDDDVYRTVGALQQTWDAIEAYYSTCPVKAVYDMPKNSEEGYQDTFKPTLSYELAEDFDAIQDELTLFENDSNKKTKNLDMKGQPALAAEVPDKILKIVKTFLTNTYGLGNDACDKNDVEQELQNERSENSNNNNNNY